MGENQRTTIADVGGACFGVLIAFCVVCPCVGIPLLLLVVVGFAHANDPASPSTANMPKPAPANEGYRPIVQPGMLFFLAALFFAASALVVVALFADDKPGLYVICCAAGGVIGTILLALPGLYIQSKMLSVGRQRSLTSRPSSHER